MHAIEPDATLDFIMGRGEDKPPLALSRPYIEEFILPIAGSKRQQRS